MDSGVGLGGGRAATAARGGRGRVVRGGRTFLVGGGGKDAGGLVGHGAVGVPSNASGFSMVGAGILEGFEGRTRRVVVAAFLGGGALGSVLVVLGTSMGGGRTRFRGGLGGTGANVKGTVEGKGSWNTPSPNVVEDKRGATVGGILNRGK